MEFDIRDVSVAVAEKFQHDFRAGNETILAHLADTRLAQPFAGAIRVKVWEYTPPVSEALLPGWEGNRGEMKFAALRVRQSNAAIVHELCHVHAPNQSRFLAEGCAVYLEERLGNLNAYPTFGERIESRMRKVSTGALAHVRLDLFDRVPTQRGTNLFKCVELETIIPNPSERSEYTYLVAGSFVKFLIEAYGWERFTALYALSPLTPGVPTSADPERYRPLFGKSIADLQSEWLVWLDAIERQVKVRTAS